MGCWCMKYQSVLNSFKHLLITVSTLKALKLKYCCVGKGFETEIQLLPIVITITIGILNRRQEKSISNCCSILSFTDKIFYFLR